MSILTAFCMFQTLLNQEHRLMLARRLIGVYGYSFLQVLNTFQRRRKVCNMVGGVDLE